MAPQFSGKYRLVWINEEDFSRKYNITSDFRDEIAYYIDSIYKTADFKDSSFVENLIRRIELQMEETDGAAAYKKDLAIDSTFVPYSKIVQLRKQAKITEQTEKTASLLPQLTAETTSNTFNTDTDFSANKSKTDNDIYNKNESETHKQTHCFDNSPAHTNVLLLALSTFQNVIRKSTFSYDFCGCKGEVTGRYQLDPIPKMLDELLAQNGENLDRIIMLCTDDTTQKIASI